MKATKRKDGGAPVKEQVSYWRGKADKQQLLIDSILSLLNKYANCLDLHGLHREFLLTLMGHYTVTDTCLFTTVENTGEMVPVLKFGKIRNQSLPTIGSMSEIIAVADRERKSLRVSELNPTAKNDPVLVLLRKTVKIIGPVYLQNKLVGVVMLGGKISKKKFTEFDMALLDTLCAASAIAFNNANLMENVRCSVEEVQRLMDLRDEMISRISHEFRTPLTVMKSGLDHLASEDEDQRAICEMISGAADRFSELIDSLLVLDRTHATGRDPSKYGFNPATPIYEFVATHASDASSKGLTFEVKEIVDRNTILLRIRREDFTQVVDHLLENAIKFSTEKSTIHIAFEIAKGDPGEADGVRLLDWRAQSRRTIDAYKRLLGSPDADTPGLAPLLANPASVSRSAVQSGPYLVMRITNSGIGIPMKELENLAQPFSQASNSPDQRVHGKALGLAIVQKVVSDCHGQLFCKSEEGKFTTFSVFFPMAGL